MVAHAEHYLRQLGALKIRLMVRDTNLKVTAFYEHLGYGRRACIVLGKSLEP